MPDEESNLPATYGPDVVNHLRMQGMSVSEIAEQLSTTRTEILNSLSTYNLQASYDSDDDRQAKLNMENQRLDYYLRKLWPSVDYGDTKAIALALKITDLRTKINQLDVPSSTNKAQVLVVGGDAQSYVENLKRMLEPGDG